MFPASTEGWGASSSVRHMAVSGAPGCTLPTPAALGFGSLLGSCRLDWGVRGSAPAHRPSHPKLAVCGRQRA